jgi:hypothetical protein
MMRRKFLQSRRDAFDPNNYLTIEALEDGVVVSFTSDIEYNLDGEEWVYLDANVAIPPIKKGQTLSFRGKLIPSSEGIGAFNINGECNLMGNCMSLLFRDSAKKELSLASHPFAFNRLFSYCDGIKNVSPTFLPATTLADSCYYSMFNGCRSLTAAPELPATTLADNCYDGMFNGCRSLTAAPELPATTLRGNCYDSMFYGCTSLTTAPELPATTLRDNCYRDMFYGCTRLNYIKMLATDISAENCLYSWVFGVASTGTFVKSKDATWNVVGASGVPSGWTVITDDQ